MEETLMTKNTNIIYLVNFTNPLKYEPWYDFERSRPYPTRYSETKYGFGGRIDLGNRQMVFTCERVKTAADELRLELYDGLRGAPTFFIFFSEALIEHCFSHLIDKDIQILPCELRAGNGVIKGFYWVEIINNVHGADHERSTYSKYTGFLDKLVPKNEDFMQGHEIAREDEMGSRIYIVPSLRERILKFKKKPRGFQILTPKQYWEYWRTINEPY
jgi:hypothetical protein